MFTICLTNGTSQFYLDAVLAASRIRFSGIWVVCNVVTTCFASSSRSPNWYREALSTNLGLRSLHWGPVEVLCLILYLSALLCNRTLMKVVWRPLENPQIWKAITFRDIRTLQAIFQIHYTFSYTRRIRESFNAMERQHRGSFKTSSSCRFISQVMVALQYPLRLMSVSSFCSTETIHLLQSLQKQFPPGHDMLNTCCALTHQMRGP